MGGAAPSPEPSNLSHLNNSEITYTVRLVVIYTKLVHTEYPTEAILTYIKFTNSNSTQLEGVASLLITCVA